MYLSFPGNNLECNTYSTDYCNVLSSKGYVSYRNKLASIITCKKVPNQNKIFYVFTENYFGFYFKNPIFEMLNEIHG